MASWQWFGRLHRAVFLATNGVVGGNMAGLGMLLLTTTGRRSGEARTSPLAYMEHDGECIVVGSNNGGPRDPHWWLNLLVRSSAEIQVMRDRIEVDARLAGGSERERLWPLLVAFNPPFGRYEKKTEREIPVVVLERS